MKKILLFLVLATQLYSATPEQVERYLLISGSEDQLIDFEEMIDGMGRALAAGNTENFPLMQDSQLISIRFREYLQQHLSESEMNEIMDNYRHDVLRKLVSAEVLMEETDTMEEYRQFLARISQEPLPANRTETVRSIVRKLYDEAALIDFFDQMYLPMVKQIKASTGKELNDSQIEDMKKTYAKKIREDNYQTMLFMTRDFDDDELDELDEIAGNSASNHETRAVFGAIAYAVNEVLGNMVKHLSLVIKNKSRNGTGKAEQKKK